MKSKTQSFAKIILLLFSFISISIGMLLLFLTEWASLVTLYVSEKEIVHVVIKFLGSAYIILGVLFYVIKDLKGNPLCLAIASLLIFSFINLYLLFIFSSLIILPSIYFITQVLIQLVLMFALYDEIRRG